MGTPIKIYWEQLKLPDWHLIVAATDKGICFVGSNNGQQAELENWLAKKYSIVELLHKPAKLRPYLTDLSNYLTGKQAEIDVPLDIHGTVFQEQVWQALQAIPYGKTASYSEIAEQIGRKAAVRAVGTAIGANPALIVIPCHRVLGKNQQLTGYRGGLPMKKQLLALEG